MKKNEKKSTSVTVIVIMEDLRMENFKAIIESLKIFNDVSLRIIEKNKIK